jgi:chloramphenicol 3-O phosphotransferase
MAIGLQDVLPKPWLRFSIDDFIDALPKALLDNTDGITFGADGSVTPGSDFRALEEAWMHGIAEMVYRGAKVIIDDVLLSGVEGQRRWQAALQGLEVLWVGVMCDAEVATAREAKRIDRVAGMAASQATKVHVGVNYDVTLDTSKMTTAECVRVVLQRCGL